jgi:hypothetical protein
MPQMRAKRKKICKERLWRVLGPQEWLQRFADWRKCQPGSDKQETYRLILQIAKNPGRSQPWRERLWCRRHQNWRRFSPGSPKRQAYEIIKCRTRERRTVGSWTARIAAQSPHGRAAARVRQTRAGQAHKPD